jgi:hypothetical protein
MFEFPTNLRGQLAIETDACRTCDGTGWRIETLAPNLEDEVPKRYVAQVEATRGVETLAGRNNAALDCLRHHVSGAIERGESEAIVEQPPAQTIDKYGCLRDDRYPGVIFGREHPTSWEHIAFRPVASHNGRSTWGYMLRCRCGVESIATTTSSVGYEDAPGRFAWEHRECNEERNR